MSIFGLGLPEGLGVYHNKRGPDSGDDEVGNIVFWIEQKGFIKY